MTEYDADATDDVATDQDLDDISDNVDDDADIDDPADGDDAVDLYASVGNVDAEDAFANVDVADDLDEIPQLTADQLELDQFRRERDARAKTFGERVEDMHRGPSFGERRAAAVWARNQELERRENAAAMTPEGQAEREAAAIETVSRYMQAEDADPGPGFISGEGSEHDATEAAERRKNAMANWDSFCSDPDT